MRQAPCQPRRGGETVGRAGGREGRRAEEVDMPAMLIARRHRVDDVGEAIEFCMAQGWTDGLPVIPPTEDRVRAMLAASGLDPKQEIGYITHRAVSITA